MCGGGGWLKEHKVMEKASGKGGGIYPAPPDRRPSPAAFNCTCVTRLISSPKPYWNGSDALGVGGWGSDAI